MISFILNENPVSTDQSAGMTLLDFIRYNNGLKGTKIGCREGDCGACTVLEGKLTEGRVTYQTIVSCLTPIGNVQGKHIVTVEGVNMDTLSPVQENLVDFNGTQCGFCTPGFVISMTAYLLSDAEPEMEVALDYIDGNICRCTGYKSIERACAELVKLKQKINTSNPVEWLIKNKSLPDYFYKIPDLLAEIDTQKYSGSIHGLIVGGGTDLMVRQPDTIIEKDLSLLHNRKNLKDIIIEGSYCTIGAEVTATMIMEAKLLQSHFPNLKQHFKLIASTPIRNMGTLAGNIVNASPIGDLSIFFLALNAELFFNKNEDRRKLYLNEFFLDYKKTNLEEEEFIEKIGFQLPDKSTHFNFEKVSKRQHLDIASVNSAISLKINNENITKARLSAGGISPVPLYLREVSAFLEGKPLNSETIVNANTIAQEEISPISDIRGSEEYKRLLLRQLIIAHFIELFPEKISWSNLRSILSKK